MNVRRFAIGWAVLVVAAAASAQAPPASASESAKQLFRAGTQAYDAGEYLAAARAYEKAYEATPLAGTTFSAAQAYRRQYFVDGNDEWLRRAQALYKRYLDEQPTGGRRAHAVTHLSGIELILARLPQAPEERPPPPREPTQLLVTSTAPGALASVDGGRGRPVPLVTVVTPGTHRVIVSAPGFFEARVETLAVEGKLSVTPLEPKARPAWLKLVSDEDAAIWIDGQRIERVNMRIPISLEAGRHAIAVTDRGKKPAYRSLELARGESRRMVVDLEPTTQRIASYWLFGAAGAFAVAGGVTGVLALNAEQDARDINDKLEHESAISERDRNRYNDRLSARNDLRTATILLFATAAAAGATGGLLFVLDGDVRPGAARGERAAFLRAAGRFR